MSMTCVIGLKDGDGVLLGADTCESTQYVKFASADAKVFRVGPFGLGACGSPRMKQLLRHQLRLPDPPKTGLPRFMVTQFTDAVRKALSEGGWKRTSDGREEGGEFLVALRGRLFVCDYDFQVSEMRHDFHAVGSGQEVALGALHATRSMKPRRRIRTALEAAAEFAVGVRAPFQIIRVI